MLHTPASVSPFRQQHSADIVARNQRTAEGIIPCCMHSTPLHLAAMRGHIEISRILLKSFVSMAGGFLCMCTCLVDLALGLALSPKVGGWRYLFVGSSMCVSLRVCSRGGGLRLVWI